MSSHHFVKEKQEPAVLIYTGDDLSENILGELLEWSPVVCAHENALSDLRKLEIKIDIIFRKNLTDEEILILTNGQQSLSVIDLKTEDHPVEMLRYLVSENHSAVNVLGYPEALIKKCSAFRNEIDLIFFLGDHKIYPLKNTFKKWKTNGEKISVLTENVFHILKLNNLQQISSNEFEVVHDGVIELQLKENDLFISEQL
jgi:thiamine pyrophosphokinase